LAASCCSVVTNASISGFSRPIVRSRLRRAGDADEQVDTVQELIDLFLSRVSRPRGRDEAVLHGMGNMTAASRSTMRAAPLSEWAARMQPPAGRRRRIALQCQ